MKENKREGATPPTSQVKISGGGKNNSSNSSPKKDPKQTFTKYAVLGAMGLLFCGSMLWIFYPMQSQESEEIQGINHNIPQPSDNDIVSTKIEAYKQNQIEQQRFDRIRSLSAFSGLDSSGNVSVKDNPDNIRSISLADVDNNPKSEKVNSSGNTTITGGGKKRYSGSRNPQSAINGSAQSYQRLNSNLNSYYKNRENNNKSVELQKEIEQLKEKLAKQQTETGAVTEDPVELMEKSYQLAAKYGMNGQSTNLEVTGREGLSTESSRSSNGNLLGTSKINKQAGNKRQPIQLTNESAQGVRQAKVGVVSTLTQPISDSAYIKQMSKPRHISFNTVSDQKKEVISNTISVAIYSDQTVSDGQTIKLRLLEPIDTDLGEIPTNSTISGNVSVKGERLEILITSIGYKDAVIPVEMIAYDMDGQQGVYIPNSLERNAVKEIAANMGTSMGTTFSLTSNAGQQIAADLSKSLIKGGSQYISQKMKMVKVHLKAGYRLMLLSTKS